MQLYKNFKPLVSIVLPTYNREKLIPRAIESVLKQSFADWELIIVDDGSTDNTFNIISHFQKENQNIKYIKQQNMKLPIALNVGIQISSGKFITFIGSDDEWEKEHLQKRVEVFQQDKSIDFLHGGIKIIGSEYVPDKNNPKELIHLDNCTIGGTFFGKRETFIELDGFRNLDYSEDSDFFERLLQTRFKISKVDFKTYIYHRDNEDSITNSIKK